MKDYETYLERCIAGGFATEAKETEHSYEAFFDEYVEFMQTYQNNPSDMKLLEQYFDYMERYAEVMEKLNALEDQEMTDAELLYYAEVHSRISKKLIEVVQ